MLALCWYCRKHTLVHTLMHVLGVLQAELIKNMVDEGLLTTQHAEQFLEEIGNDLQKMDKDRNKMYW